MTQAPQPIRLTRAQVREVDRISIERYHIPGVVLMENASRAVAAAAWAHAEHRGVARRPVLVLCGGGNNGGDGLAAARHLHNHGMAVSIGLTVDPAHYKGDALANWRIVRAMGLPTFQATPESILAAGAGMIVDAIFGTGLSEAPREPFPAIARAVREAARFVVAVDLPSGLDCDTGKALGEAVRASLTVTFVAEKAGFADPASREFTGMVRVADIGCPIEVIDEVSKHRPEPS